MGLISQELRDVRAKGLNVPDFAVATSVEDVKVLWKRFGV